MPSAKPIPGESLADLNPELSSQWHPTKNGTLTPYDVKVRSAKSIWWLCHRGHEWSATADRRSLGHGCLQCTMGVEKGESLADLHPEIAKDWHPTKNGTLSPDDVKPLSNRKVWWKCDKSDDHEWMSTVSNRTRGCGCGCCRGMVVVQSNCLETVMPEVAATWHPTKNGTVTPRSVSAKSGKMIWWICENGHEWKASCADRSSGHGCQVCHKKSRGELAIAAVLDDLGILYRREFRFTNCKNRRSLPFDFLVVTATSPPKAGLIEYNGEQHYMPVERWGGQEVLEAVRRRDLRKVAFCAEKNLPLLVIPFGEFPNIKTLIEGFVKEISA